MAVAKKIEQDALSDYLSQVLNKYKTKKATEHTYRGILENFIESFSNHIEAVNEPKRVRCGAPDYIVSNKNVPIGYIEAKDITESLDKVEKSEQLTRYFNSLSNIVLTNYLEFRWYVNGKKRLSVKVGEVSKGKIKFLDKNYDDLYLLIESFLNAEIPTIKTAEDLAQRLAGATKSICKLICDAYDFEDKDGWLHRWQKAFSDVLISELDRDTFADMFAQTLAYGFFAAKTHHSGKTDFSRFAAAKILPKTNPFLRQLFAEFSGVNMPEEISWAVDEIIQILKATDMNEILKDFGKKSGKEDPVVHFYETFLASYNPKLREKRGVYYTPSQVVDYIVNSVDEILQLHFEREDGLADDKTLILDPAAGTASFLYKVIEQIHEKFEGNEGLWDSYVSDSLLERIFGFEILMAPYSVSHLKLGLQLQDSGYKFQKDQRLGVFLTNTLEEAAKKSQEMLFNWISEEANAASAIKKDKPIMVVLGNPPYSGESANNGEWITNLMHGFDSITGQNTSNYFECEGKSLGERNPRWLNDDYVKFIRFSQWRIEQTGHGVLAFVTNHGFLDNPTFRGMRESLTETFDELYLLDLHGNVKKKEKCPDGSKDQNVFDIQQGVCISFFVKKKVGSNKHKCKVYRSDLWGDRETKYKWLQSKTLKTTKWTEIKPNAPYFLFNIQDTDVWDEYNNGVKVTDIFNKHSAGLIAGRDSLAIHYNKDELWDTIKKFKSTPTEEARNKWKLGKDARDWKVADAQADLNENKLSKDKIIKVLYRPFDIRYTYYTGKSKGFLRWPKADITPSLLAGDNIALITSRMTKGESFKHVHFSENMAETICLSAKTSNNGFVFPLFLSNSDELDLTGDNKRYNISDKVTMMFEQSLDLKYTHSEKRNKKSSFNGTDLFYYISSILNSNSYQERYEKCLKVDFPNIPLISNNEMFWNLVDTGKRIVDKNLQKGAKVKNKFPVKGDNIVEKHKFKENRIYINNEQYISDVSKAVYDFHVGGYPVCDKWLKSRKGRHLSHSEIKDLCKIISSIEDIISIKEEIDNIITKQIGSIENLFNLSKAVSSDEILNIIDDAKKVKSKLSKKKSKRKAS